MDLNPKVRTFLIANCQLPIGSDRDSAASELGAELSSKYTARRTKLGIWQSAIEIRQCQSRGRSGVVYVKLIRTFLKLTDGAAVGFTENAK